MKNKIHPNILIFKVFVLYVENDFNFYRTAQQMNRNRSNLYRMYLVFCNQLQASITYTNKSTNRTYLTSEGEIIYNQAKIIIKAYEQIEECYK